MKKIPIALAGLGLFVQVGCVAKPLLKRKIDTVQLRGIVTVQLQSKLVAATLPYNVILPTDYETSPTTRYPVLYLLHGLSGHYSDWAANTKLADYAAQYRMIIVTPEGNNNWYTDSVGGAPGKYESYILQELIPDVEKRYRTIQSRSGRAIAGLSMGGYGALKFGLKHPDAFVFAGSLSGAFRVTRYTEKETPAGTARELIPQIFGPVGSPTRKANDLFEIVRSLPAAQIDELPYFYFACGTEDSSQININRKLAELFTQKKIAHEYRESPGEHNWAYWDRQVQAVLKIAALKLRLPDSVQATLQRGVRPTIGEASPVRTAANAS